MPILVIQLNEGTVTRIRKFNKFCGICNVSLRDMKVGDLVLRKTAGKSKMAHVDCGIQKNWITKQDFNKVYVPLVTLKK